jgi:hypothetical protein
MAKTVHCGPCNTELPMLDESEWEQILSYLGHGLREIPEYWRAYGTTIREAKEHIYGQGAGSRPLSKYRC